MVIRNSREEGLKLHNIIKHLEGPRQPNTIDDTPHRGIHMDLCPIVGFTHTRPKCGSMHGSIRGPCVLKTQLAAGMSWRKDNRDYTRIGWTLHFRGDNPRRWHASGRKHRLLREHQ